MSELAVFDFSNGAKYAHPGIVSEVPYPATERAGKAATEWRP